MSFKSLIMVSSKKNFGHRLSHIFFWEIHKKVGLLYVACTRSNSDPYQNISYGIVAVIAVLIGPLSLILFPNCTFIRPHPACWRMVFGASLVYFLSLVFMLFLNMEQVRIVLQTLFIGYSMTFRFARSWFILIHRWSMQNEKLIQLNHMHRIALIFHYPLFMKL